MHNPIGGIYQARTYADTPQVFVLVHGTDEADQELAVTLLSPDVELGSSTDLLLAVEDTGLPYRLLAEADVFTYLPAARMGRRVGQVPSRVLEALAALRNDDPVEVPVAGPPVLTAADPRWQFQLAELDRLTHPSGT